MHPYPPRVWISSARQTSLVGCCKYSPLIVRQAKCSPGNAPEATFANAEALGVLDHVALHTASFTTTLPFDDNHFALVTSSLAIHNVSAHERKVAVAELARITAPGGRIIILELMGYAQGYKETLRKVCGWQDVEVSMAGAEVMFGAWPCQVLAARKPTVAKS